jgi:dephospho-CoA kinase
MPKQVIGLVGPIASGKSTIVKLLSDRGFKAYSLSDIIRQEIRSRNEEITRESLNRVSNELRETQGPDIFAKRTLNLIQQDNPEYIVIDAIRNPAEVNFLKNSLNAFIIGITAPQEKRFEFIRQRGANIAGIENFEQFRELDDREFAQEGDHKQQVQAALSLSDVFIENDGTLEDLTQKVELALASLAD